jgi:RNA polymerase sigma factor (sigma-70 family)
MAKDVDVKNNAFDEETLIRKSREGDLRSFSRLVEMHRERVVRAAYSFVGNLEDAADLSQEAFIKAYDKLNEFNFKSRFYTWLYRILINTCKDFLRRKKIQGFFFVWEKKLADDETDSQFEGVETSKNAGERLLNKELGEEIVQAMDCLPLQQRMAFSLRYLDGLLIQEVAESMDLSVGAVKAHLWQAIQKLQKWLKPYIEERNA